MAIFPRRTLQRLIYENASFLTRSQLRKHVNGLNDGDINVEWEVVILNIFSKLGTVVHERDLKGKKPDLLFLSENPSLNFLSDIKTVCDDGIETKNPVGVFVKRLADEIFTKRGLRGRWNYEVQGTHDEVRTTGGMVQLKLPAVFRFDDDIFNAKFVEFLQKVAEHPNSTARLVIKDDATDIVISYQPSEEAYLTGGHPSFKQITAFEHLTKNSVYNGLESKADQLRQCDYDGMKGIILCDGGSEFLPRGKRIIEEFFRAYPYINFVLSFSVQSKLGSTPQTQIYFEEGPNLDAELRGFLDNLHTHDNIFPYPRIDARNARNDAKRPPYLSRGLGHMKISGNRITLSARKALLALAGDTDCEPSKEQAEFFQRMRDEGRLIVSVEFAKGEEEIDDDYLTLLFGDRDAAVSAFEVPAS